MTPEPMQRGGPVAWGGAVPSPEQLGSQAREWQGALPYTRLTDYGMDAAGAPELLWRPARGEDWVVVAREIGGRELARADSASSRAGRLTEIGSVRASAAALNLAQIPLNFDTA